MKILAIETSCDETGISVVEGMKTEDGFAFRVLGSALNSQASLHAPFGGVYPTLAKREHEKNLPTLLNEVAADVSLSEIDAIAVTNGPGLEPALWSGITFAQKLAEAWKLPLIPVNHLEGHLVSSLVTHDGTLENIKLPVLALLISGGHTEFVLMRDWFKYEVIGKTLDDAVGEAFDKVARMLGLPYPGGPHISRLAESVRTGKENTEGGCKKSFAKVLGSPSSPTIARSARLGQTICKGFFAASQTPTAKDFLRRPAHLPNLPRPMINSGTCDVSFSGLKTAALYAIRDMTKNGTPLTDDEKAHFAREFEDAAADVFVSKTRRALEKSGASTFVIGGGVAANRHIRNTLEQLVTSEFPDVAVRMPDIAITGDNATMIAYAALARSLAGVQKIPPSESIRAVGNLSISGEK